MRIWTRKSALIQPRTSCGKSDGVVAAAGLRPPGSAREPLRGLGAHLRADPRDRAAVLALRARRRHRVRIRLLFKILSKVCQNSVKFYEILYIFYIQYSMFQHFSKPTSVLQNSMKMSAKIRKILQIFIDFELSEFPNFLTSKCFPKF